MLSNEEQSLYSRNILVPQIGPSGQEKLKNANVAVIGAGGLGSPVLQYLAGAGIGHITVIDGDKVELSNLNRQTIHDTEKIDTNKAENAAQRLSKINPYIQIKAVNQFLDDSNYKKILAGHGLILDCTDGMQTKLSILGYSQSLDIPLIHGGVVATMGQMMLIIPRKTSCFACIIEDEAHMNLISCSEGGIIGGVAGIIGSMMALEAVKYIVGIKEKLNRIYFYDGITNRLTPMEIKKNQQCKYCSDTDKK